MLDPSKRFLTVVLLCGIIVLVAGIALGERAGDKVIGQVTEKRLTSIAPVTVTPEPQGTVAPYGPDWKRSDVMAAAPDPEFPDPRVPPVPPPTPLPPPKFKPSQLNKRIAPKPSPTPNLNVPIWRRTAPLPTPTPTGSESPSASPSAEPTATP